MKTREESWVVCGTWHVGRLASSCHGGAVSQLSKYFWNGGYLLQSHLHVWGLRLSSGKQDTGAW